MTELHLTNDLQTELAKDFPSANLNHRPFRSLKMEDRRVMDHLEAALAATVTLRTAVDALVTKLVGPASQQNTPTDSPAADMPGIPRIKAITKLLVTHNQFMAQRLAEIEREL